MIPSFTVDRSTNSMIFERIIGAPLDQVFAAWTTPAQIRQWWDPAGVPLAACQIDLRVGGAFTFENAGAKGPPFTGTYLDIEPPGKLVFEAMGAVGTVMLEARDLTTHMIVTIRCASAQHLAQFIQHGVDVGTAKTFDNLRAFLS